MKAEYLHLLLTVATHDSDTFGQRPLLISMSYSFHPRYGAGWDLSALQCLGCGKWERWIGSY